MHFNFDFSARQVLWTLTFAAQLVLLVVLLGRDRMRRYPWFTAGVALYALQLMAEVLLSNRMAPLTLREIFLTLADLAAIVALLVVVEVARRAFAGAGRLTWINGVMALVVVAGVVLAVWGPWPARKDLAWDSTLGKLRLMQLAAQKGSLLVNLLTVELGLLVVLFGRHFKAGWRSHTQMIAIGLSTVAISWLAVQAVVQSIVRTAHPQSQAEYQRILATLGNQRILATLGKLVNANKMVYLAALLWWIVWLWLDEPRAAAGIPAAILADETSAEAAAE